MQTKSIDGLWHIGQLKDETPNWMTALGEALSGIRLVEQTELQRIPQDQYRPLRQRYIDKLRQAAASGDSTAQTLLASLNQ